MYHINKISILLVEDDADLTQYWAAQLASRFARVYRAGHGFEALETLHRHAPDIVMVDVGLPEMDGFSLCQEIRDHPDFSRIPVILYKSGYLSAEDQRQAQRSGAVRIIRKPRNVDEIVEIVQTVYTEQRVKMVVDSGSIDVPDAEPRDGGYADFLTRQLGETISQLKQEQAALSRALERYKDFSHQRSDFFWETDANGLLTFLDAGAQNRLSLPETHYRGVSFIDFFGRFLSADGLDQFSQAFSRLGVLDVSCKLRDRNNFRIVRLQGKPYYLSDHGFAGYRGSLTDITDTKLTSEKLYFAAHHDAMTGLLNAQAFKSLLEGELQMLQQNEHHVLCYLDLDFFKEVNDRAGHRAGDQLLVQLADLFRRKVRSNDVVARIGGDEFAILLRNCNLDQARRLIQELHNSIKTFRFYWEGQRFEIGLSIGLLEIENSTLSVTEVMDMADQACYSAKHAGRNQIRVFGDRQTSGELTGDALWLEKFHTAVNSDQLCLFQQPIRHGRRDSGSSAYEVLVRMRDGERLISPSHFLSVIERYKLTAILDRWVVYKLVDYLDSGEFQGEFYSVNISTASLCDPEFRQQIHALLEERPGVSGKLCFEVTESSAMENLDAAIEFMSAMRKLGCRFALDDFGTGFSSLSHLKNLPVDFVKLDGVFVRGIVTDPVDFGLVESIQRIAGLMNIQTIAEYVENEEIAGKLRSIGVDYLQGYHIGHPEMMRQKTPLTVH